MLRLVSLAMLYTLYRKNVTVKANLEAKGIKLGLNKSGYYL